MLIGQYETKIDEKGRCALPSKFREKLGSRIICAKWYEFCLVVVSEQDWDALLNKLTGKTDVITTPVRDTDRFILGSAFEAELDSQGRYVVPKVLRDYAGIVENIIFLGLGNRVEIWDLEAWRKKEKEIQEKAEKMIEEIASRNI